MSVSVFELFKIGIGPSSSHTVGPMIAARRFCEWIDGQGLLRATAKVAIDLYGSLALTGKGHATDTALILGLTGAQPATFDIDLAPQILSAVANGKRIALLSTHEVSFDPAADIRYLQLNCSRLVSHRAGVSPKSLWRMNALAGRQLKSRQASTPSPQPWPTASIVVASRPVRFPED